MTKHFSSNSPDAVRSADVIIIGGGVIGCAIAYYLTCHQIKPLIIERRDLASGSSGACDGFLSLQSKKPGLHLSLALKSLAMFKTLSEELGYDVEFRSHGGLIIIETELERELMDGLAAKHRDSGLDITLLDKSETLRTEPALRADVLGATYCPLEGTVNPIRLTLGFALAARRNGAKFQCGTEVIGLDFNHDRVSGVKTSSGKVGTGLVIDAAGSWAAQIGRWAGLDLPIVPRRGQLLVTEARPPLLFHGILSAKYLVAKYHPEKADWTNQGVSLEQTRAGNILIGSTREFVGHDTSTTMPGLLQIARNGLRLVPTLKNWQIIRTFAGLRPYTPDGLPLLGAVREVPGLFLAAGHEGDGLALSAITGRLVAQAISTGSDLGLPAELKYDRFKQRANSFGRSSGLKQDQED